MGLVVAVSLLTAIPCAVAIWRKGRRLAAAHGGRWSVLPWLGIAALLPGLGGPLLTVSYFVGAFTDVADITDSASKSVVLARGISRAVGIGFWPSLAGLLLFFVAFFLIGYGSVGDPD